MVKLLATKTRQEQNFWKLVKFESFNIDKPRISFPIDIVNPMESAVEGAMREALQQARLAGESGDVPVGAVVVHQGKVISSRHNERELTNDPTAHAEILALRDAAKTLGTWRLTECTLVVTLEPCIMCAGALMNARIGTLVYATADLKGGATASLYNVCTDPRLNHQPKVMHGVCENDAEKMLSDFFSAKRLKN